MKPVSRAHEKLTFALKKLNINLNKKICADFGSSTGGFVQAILESNCKRIYSIETSRNRLHFVLKDDQRVIVLDKTNAIHVNLPEMIDFISIDVGWTPQKLVLPNAEKYLKRGGIILSLIKPHYELKEKKPKEEEIKKLLKKLKKELPQNLELLKIINSPITGKKAKNKEYFFYLKKN